jgi:hypothetical protein
MVDKTQIRVRRIRKRKRQTKLSARMAAVSGAPKQANRVALNLRVLLLGGVHRRKQKLGLRQTGVGRRFQKFESGFFIH